MKTPMSQSQVALLLQVSTVLAAFVAAFVFFWYIPMLGWEVAIVNELEWLFPPCLAVTEVLALLVFLALWEFWHVCRRIGENNSFCRSNARSFRRISRYALTAAGLLLALLVVMMKTGYCNGAWFIVLTLVICVPLGIFVLAFCLSHLISNAAELKEQTDLTI